MGRAWEHMEVHGAEQALPLARVTTVYPGVIGQCRSSAVVDTDKSALSFREYQADATQDCRHDNLCLCMKERQEETYPDELG